MSCESGSVPLDQVGTACRQLVRIGPEVGNAGDQTSVVELEEAETGLRALRAGELDPAHRARAFDEDPLDGDVPFAWKALHVETE